MKWEVKESIFKENCEEEAKRVFAQYHLFSKDELITSIEYSLEYIQTQKALTQNSRMEMTELYERFLSAVKKCKLPDLSSEKWRHYQYDFVGDGITLELCTANEIEFHDNELDCIRISDSKELLRVNCRYVTPKEFASIQGVTEKTVTCWINAGKLKSAKLYGDTWLIPAVQERPQRGRVSYDYIIEPGLRIDEYPFVQHNEQIWIKQDDNDKTMYNCSFNYYSEDFHEEVLLTKAEGERLEFLLISSGKAKIGGFVQYMPVIK